MPYLRQSILRSPKINTELELLLIQSEIAVRYSRNCENWTDGGRVGCWVPGL